LDLVSIDFLTKTWVDWSYFLVAHCGNWRKVPFQWPAPPLIQHGRYGSHLGFGFRRLSHERLRRLVQYFGGSLGVINLHHVLLLPKPYLPCTHRQLPTRGGGAYAMP
jgi:hypothetical protein